MGKTAYSVLMSSVSNNSYSGYADFVRSDFGQFPI